MGGVVASIDNVSERLQHGVNSTLLSTLEWFKTFASVHTYVDE